MELIFERKKSNIDLLVIIIEIRICLIVTTTRHETDKYTYDQRNSSSRNSHGNYIKKCRQRLEKQRNREMEEREIPREQ